MTPAPHPNLSQELAPHATNCDKFGWSATPNPNPSQELAPHATNCDKFGAGGG